MPPDDALIEVTVFLRDDEYQHPERLARLLDMHPVAAMEKAVSTELFVRGFLREGAVFEFRKADGTRGRIEL